MASEEAINLSPEERIKTLTFQLVKLHEHCSEDRQTFNKHIADQAEILKQFTEQLKNFENLEPQVRKQLIDSFQRLVKTVTDEVGAKIGEAATVEIDKTVRRLGEVVSSAASTLSNYQALIKSNFLTAVLMTIGTAIITSLAIVWLLMPKPILPLTGDMLNTYNDGAFMQKIWPKLPKKMRKSINDILLQEFNKSSALPVPASNNGNADDINLNSN